MIAALDAFSRPWASLRGTAAKVRDKSLRYLMRVYVPVSAHMPLRRLGSDRCGWIVPDEVLHTGAVCYCAGLGEDGSFDLELATTYHCEVVTLDPTPKAIAYAEKALRGSPVQFLPVGLWSEDTTLRFYEPANPEHVSHSIVNLQRTTGFVEAPCRSLPSLMAELGHTHLQLLKLDIEGAEYEVLLAMLRDGVRPDVICVDFDQPVPVRKTLRQIAALRGVGYNVVAIEAWNYTFVAKE